MKNILLLIAFIFLPKNLKGACANKSLMKLYSGPSRKSEVLWVVKRYMPFRVLKKKGNWVKVSDIDGDESWVKSKYLKKTIKCAVVTEKQISTFKDKAGEIIDEEEVLKQYQSLKVLKEIGQLVLVKDTKGKEYWVKKSKLWPLKDS